VATVGPSTVCPGTLYTIRCWLLPLTTTLSDYGGLPLNIDTSNILYHQPLAQVILVLLVVTVSTTACRYEDWTLLAIFMILLELGD